ncbi:sigma factor [Nocardioides sp. AE5]|uniref:RNA polymerase sigma factor n=1 Tax=Nocardioides sp. AE5 TaxID=2962573 RepID=UPI002882B44F|nr:sigma factor [Nocardioides sp. AE5]MDT0200454.1 sigma factor [Nocardioides sp. AE5]
MGAEEQFRSFYDTHVRRVATFALGLSGDHAEARDLAQEALARAWSRWRQVRGHPHPEAWLFTVKSHAACGQARLARALADPTADPADVHPHAEREAPR